MTSDQTCEAVPEGDVEVDDPQEQHQIKRRNEVAPNTKNDIQIASASMSTSFNIPPDEINPLPKMKENTRGTRKRKSVGTVILTSTPYKDELIVEQQKKNEKEEKKQEKDFEPIIKTSKKNCKE
uniref:Uncharacterized protein n=1 Tax=Photinus pyralis TaxID=7054 RepID=A0A1Y1LUD6_PHOPY